MNFGKSPEGLRIFAKGYTRFATDPSALLDTGGREKKAMKIKEALKTHGIATDIPQLVLDVGCSQGWMLKSFVVSNGLYVGVDLDYAAMRDGAESVDFVVADAETLPFKSDCFDIILCNHVYEHTDNARHLLQEIKRVLKKEGICYFSGPNKFSPVESHYGLPFLSWLPRSLADICMRISGKGEAYLWKPLAYSVIKSMLVDLGFFVTDCTKTIIDDPGKYHIEDILPPGSLKQKLAKFVLKTVPAIFPEFVFLLGKNTSTAQS
jgi:SAM-dependent methyltransferase